MLKVKVISLPYIFSGFVCFVLCLAKISGERLQDHWSSGFLFYSPYSCFGLNLRDMVKPHMYCQMQNKLSSTRGSPLGSMG